MSEVEKIEQDLLVSALRRKWGYDFSEYSEASLHRRIRKALTEEKLGTISELQSLVLRDEAALSRLLFTISVHVSDMFRDPDFFLFFRKEVVPLLKTYPKISIWHAGCAGGEEVYSMAILLAEEDLYGKCTIYATDFSDKVVEFARRGIYGLGRMKEYTGNYQQAGGKESFGDYYTAEYDHAKMDERLKKNIVFSVHNLVTDGGFGEMNVIVCRNVLIYFQRSLQQRVLQLFYNNLGRRGVLCLGMKENLEFSPVSGLFECIDTGLKIYRKGI